MALVAVSFHWDDRFGPCYDCGRPAAYEAPDIYGKDKPVSQANRFCGVCAAIHAADGERIIWLFREND